MNWVRIACDIEDDPQVRAMARALGVDVTTAVGLMVRVLARMPKHARDGNVAHLDPMTFEDWTDWRGAPGAFAREFVARFVVDGVVRSWEKHNGAAIREADRRAEVQRRRRASRRTQRESLETERDRRGETDHGTRSDTGHDARHDTDPETPPPQRPRKATRTDAATVPPPVPGYASGYDTPGVFTNVTGRDVPSLSHDSDGTVPASETRTPEELAAAKARAARCLALFRAESSRPTPSEPLARLVALA